MPEQGSHVADRLHTTGLTEKPKKNFSGINYLGLYLMDQSYCTALNMREQLASP